MGRSAGIRAALLATAVVVSLGVLARPDPPQARPGAVVVVPGAPLMAKHMPVAEGLAPLAPPAAADPPPQQRAGVPDGYAYWEGEPAIWATPAEFSNQD